MWLIPLTLLALGYVFASIAANGYRKERDIWRDAVIDHLAIACIDAPQDEHPRDTIHRIIATHVDIALDPRANGGTRLTLIGDAPVIHIDAEYIGEGLGARSPVSVERVEVEDDGSFTAVTRDERFWAQP